MNSEHKLTGSWISIGGSYPGSLSGWLRIKYPHLVEGSVASSGPVNAKPNFPECLEVVVSALKKESDECSVNVKTAVNKIQYLTQHRHIKRTFYACSSEKNIIFVELDGRCWGKSSICVSLLMGLIRQMWQH